ncbi:MAG TPA: SDR family NAD(P)-dependent oxidoreductase [Alphaproteobacteria bacterium]|jgi:NAD(P)-dependent dehydrogenase (short-subunit alcohol dehydrogenase family)|nr:SDR family NAD(P)-dependent oxidoreductase [Alphaproteobacteria bacterium]
MADKRVAVVTGASRGAGRGIAIALGAHGYTVYVTGRTLKEGEAPLPGTIGETAAEVTRAGGKGIAVQVDHANDYQVKALFEQVEQEQGRLDILVNNVAYIDDQLILPGGFWEKTLDLVKILDVGLRSQYVASYYAAPMMVKQKKGLIVFTSSFGSVCYMHGAAYGAQKAGVDKFAADMAVDLKDHNVAALSIWMGMLMTERSKKAIAEHPDIYGKLAEMAETPEYTGHVIASMYDDPNIMELTGQTVIGAEIAVDRYGLSDEGGKRPISHRPFLGDPRVPHPAIVR